MDNLNIPACAMYRQIGTVIVKTDDVDFCERTCSGACTDYVRMPAKCELCCRTRISSQYSDCDSDIVKKCRYYRSSSARSRYVNVCAAVCLLLLVGGLSPQSSAAPLRRGKMAGQRRSSDENNLWGNPCDYSDDAKLPSGLPKVHSAYTPDVAKRVANQARSALSTAEKFKDVLAKKLHSFDQFEEMLPHWESTHWLRSDVVQATIPEATLPKEKTRIGQPVPEDDLKKVLTNIDGTLPSIHKALKMVIAGLYAIKQDGFNKDLDAELALQYDFEVIMNHCRQVLCVLNDVLASRSIETIPLEDSEIPDVRAGDRLANVFLIYRDTLLYLDWLAQLMDGLASQG